jgi:hypothetical protein
MGLFIDFPVINCILMINQLMVVLVVFLNNQRLFYSFFPAMKSIIWKSQSSASGSVSIWFVFGSVSVLFWLAFGFFELSQFFLGLPHFFQSLYLLLLASI